ncbi:MAG: hypothetical protein JWP87_1387 [Labilithrix sp.]|nr:hypothetical protein [Labilithrix sp.]
MPTNTALSRGLRLSGPAALVATAGGLAAIAVHELHWIEWGLLAYAGVVGAAGIGLARKSMPLQVLSRATAWTVLAPSVLVTMISLSGGHIEWMAAALAASSGGALLLARPMLHTPEARAEFAPSSFRRWLLASATASAGTGIVTGLFALDGMRWHLGTAIPLLGLAFSLLASAVGVVRMRAWGILLGGLTSVLTLVAALFMHDAAGMALALATIPGFMFILPVLIAKRERAKADAASYTRVASHVSFDDAPSRVRIASDSSDALDDDTDASDVLAAPPPPAARAQA